MVLHYWPRFQTYLVPFWGVNGQETPQNQPKIVLSAFIEIFEITKLGNYKSNKRET